MHLLQECLLRGTIPSQDLINHLLMKAGLLTEPSLKMKAEMNITTTMNVKTTKANFENSILHKNGAVVNERFRQHRETSNFSTGNNSNNDKKQLTNGAVGLGESSSSSSIPIIKSPTSPKSSCSRDGLIYDESNVLVSGPLEELISELVPRGVSTSTDENYQFTFLLSSRLFLTPTQLLNQVVKRSQALAQMLSRESHPTFISNLVTLLSRWMIWFPPDFMEASMIQKTKKLEALALEYHPAVSAKFQHLMVTLNSHLSAIEKHEKALEKLANLTLNTSGDYEGENDIESLDLKPAQLAEELTRIELEHLTFLGPEEVVNAFAKDSSTKKSSQHTNQASSNDDLSSDARYRAAKKTKNLEAYIAWFNRLSYLVASTVVKVIIITTF